VVAETLVVLRALSRDADHGRDHEGDPQSLTDGEHRRTIEGGRDEPVPDHAQNPAVEDGEWNDGDEESGERPATRAVALGPSGRCVSHLKYFLRIFGILCHLFTIDVRILNTQDEV